jgi:imidazolonepropionase-like amidohydrolase
VALVGGTVLTGRGERFEPGTIVFGDGRIVAVGPAVEIEVPDGARVVDAEGQFVTPGLIDTHSHMGVYPSPHVDAHADGNEMTDPTTPYVFSEHAFWPQDPALQAAVLGGVTTIQVLPGSGNVIGGRAVTLKLRPQRETRAMRFPDAPFGLKMACGENPKRVYGSKGRRPMSRMGNIFELREAFIRAREYAWKWKAWEREHEAWAKKRARAEDDPEAPRPGKEPESPSRDLGLETLAAVLDGEIRVHIHCYRADEMLQMLALADELGYSVSTFHHAVEAYKIADVLAERGVHASVWADWWGFKIEAYDATEANAAIVHAAGGAPDIHSDSEIGVQRLNQEAAKALAAGRRHGLQISEDDALKWITVNPAQSLGIDDQTGSLEPGKMADVVVWDRNPFSIYARTQRVYIDGDLVFDRDRPHPRWSDFLVGSAVEETHP